MLQNHPSDFVLLQIHLDSYGNAWGNARATFYNVGGTPDAWFDGVTEASGSYQNVNLDYNRYNGIYNTRKAVPTDVTIQLSGHPLSGQTYEIQARVCIEAGGAAKTMRVHIAQVLDHWPASPTYSRWGFKQAAAYEDVTLSPGGCQDVVRNFTFDADSWNNQTQIKIVAWAQTTNASAPSNVYNAAVMGWPFEIVDCNSNGVHDATDIAEGTSMDCQPNGTPDECEGGADCNENGVLDECDIAGSTSADCQPNTVPDECEMDGNDCNANGTPDDCDVAPSIPVSTAFNLSTNPGWTMQGLWMFGDPTGGGSHNHDPNTGYTGANVYGYNLYGDYANGMVTTMYLTTGAIDCSGQVQSELRFQRWLGVEPYDTATIEVSPDGLNWTTVWQNPTTTINDSSWSLQTVDISSVADDQETVYVRWGMGPTDAGVTYPGWNIDDVEVYGLLAASQDVNGNGVPDECECINDGDFNGDGHAGPEDYADFEACLDGPADACGTGCETGDVDCDGDVDLCDFAALQGALGG